MSTDPAPPSPVPVGLVPLVDCPAALAARMGRDELSRPVEVWRHRDTGEIKTNPDLEMLVEMRKHYRDVILEALRIGRITALLLPSTTEALPAAFWQWPEGRDALETGVWQAQQLVVSSQEIGILSSILLVAQDDWDSNAMDDSFSIQADRVQKVAESPEKPARARGRRSKPIWSPIITNVAMRMSMEGRPEKLAEIEKWISDAAAAEGVSFADSSVRTWASGLFEAYDRWVDKNAQSHNS